jgi:hypothetical protein
MVTSKLPTKIFFIPALLLRRLLRWVWAAHQPCKAVTTASFIVGVGSGTDKMRPESKPEYLSVNRAFPPVLPLRNDWFGLDSRSNGNFSHPIAHGAQ